MDGIWVPIAAHSPHGQRAFMATALTVLNQGNPGPRGMVPHPEDLDPCPFPAQMGLKPIGSGSDCKDTSPEEKQHFLECWPPSLGSSDGQTTI